MFNFYLLIYFLKDNAKKVMGFMTKTPSGNKIIRSNDSNYESEKLNITNTAIENTNSNSDKTITAEIMSEKNPNTISDVSVVKKKAYY